jgi:hypothetical protein
LRLSIRLRELARLQPGKDPAAALVPAPHPAAWDIADKLLLPREKHIKKHDVGRTKSYSAKLQVHFFPLSGNSIFHG